TCVCLTVSHLSLSPPRKRGPRGAAPSLALDPRFRGGDSTSVSRGTNPCLVSTGDHALDCSHQSVTEITKRRDSARPTQFLNCRVSRVVGSALGNRPCSIQSGSWPLLPFRY